VRLLRAGCSLVVLAAIPVALAGIAGASLGAARGNGEDAKAPQQIYADMKKALRSATSLRIHTQGTLQDSTSFTADTNVGPTTTYEVDTNGPTVIETLTTRRALYVRGGMFGPAWTLASTDPSCLMAGTQFAFDVLHVGTLTKGAVTTVGARRAVEIDDDGKAPGATPRHVLVALDGPPLPLQVLQTAVTTPGSSCPLSSAAGNPVVSADSLWRANVAVKSVSVPRHAIDRRQVIQAAALYAPASQTLNSALNAAVAQASSDPNAFTQGITRTGDAYRTFVTAISAIKFPPELQAQVQALLAAANNGESAAAAAASAVAQGDLGAPFDRFTQSLSAFDAAAMTFEAQLKQAL